MTAKWIRPTQVNRSSHRTPARWRALVDSPELESQHSLVSDGAYSVFELGDIRSDQATATPIYWQSRPSQWNRAKSAISTRTTGCQNFTSHIGEARHGCRFRKQGICCRCGLSDGDSRCAECLARRRQNAVIAVRNIDGNQNFTSHTIQHSRQFSPHAVFASDSGMAELGDMGRSQRVKIGRQNRLVRRTTVARSLLSGAYQFRCHGMPDGSL